MSGFEGPDGWRLMPEGAAVHREAKTAVIADVHLGYEWARALGGDCVPAHSLAETVDKLARLLDRVTVDRLVVAGDLVESRKRCPRTEADLESLANWLSGRGVDLVALAGNHDPPRRPAWPARIVVAGWTVAHGHRKVAAKRTITGHWHPLLRAEGVSAPCFLVTESTIVLPAFSPNAAGVSVETLDLGAVSARCVATAGDAVLDFGAVSDLFWRACRSGP